MTTYRNPTPSMVILFDWKTMQHYGIVSPYGTIQFNTGVTRVPVVRDMIKLGKLKKVVRKKK